VDLSSPFVDATLQDGSRLHVVIPDITKDHWHVNIRKFVVKADHLDDLVRLGTVTRQAAKFLEACVVAGLNILVAGGTQAEVIGDLDQGARLLECARRGDRTRPLERTKLVAG